MHFLLFSNNGYLPLLATQKTLFMQGKHAYLRLHGSMPEPGQPQVECLLCVLRNRCSKAQMRTEALLTLRMNCMQQRKKMLHSIAN